jgi:hypothetical protein
MTSGKLGRVKRLAALIGIFALGPIAHYLWLLLTVDDPRNIQQAIATSANVASLERIAASAETAEGLLPKRELNYQPKDLRVAAYARLGELATAESIRAQKRVAAAFRDKPLIPPRVSLDVKWTHPAWHWGDSRPLVGVATHLDDGQRVVILLDDFLGPPYLFLMRCGPGAVQSAADT